MKRASIRSAKKLEFFRVEQEEVVTFRVGALSQRGL